MVIFLALYHQIYLSELQDNFLQLYNTLPDLINCRRIKWK